MTIRNIEAWMIRRKILPLVVVVAGIVGATGSTIAVQSSPEGIDSNSSVKSINTEKITNNQNISEEDITYANATLVVSKKNPTIGTASEEVIVPIVSGNKSEVIRTPELNEKNYKSNDRISIQANQEYSDSDTTMEDDNMGYHDLYSEIEGEADLKNQLKWEAEGSGQTTTAFEEVPETVTLSSEIEFHGAAVSEVSIPPGVSFEVDGSSAEVTLEVDGDEFDEDEDWHNLMHEYANAEATSYVSIYGITQSDSVTFDYGSDGGVTLSQEVGDDCLTRWSC
ncbi:hypothetical protein [Natrinema versiforme]|uniref:Uncharacterized protein n=1 Tax=Natrinema versiforme TaxID=88724 RepID=A0A4V1FYW3_9EURY|nr:hypothetical protein [Natrinema versiforme]QCS41464.1 hypothetical protein FEJ81_03510 [Natrinema versiforme]